MTALDPLLLRQLDLLGVPRPEVAPAPEAWGHLLSWISEHYRQMEADRHRLRAVLEARVEELVDRLARERSRSDAHRATLRAAGRLQRAWSPRSALAYPGLCVVGYCQAADEVGGDWWASYALDDERVVVVVADAIGHGVDAALLTGVVKGACDVIVRSAHPRSSVTPRALLVALNRSVIDAASEHATMTCSVGLLDQSAGTVTLASAGHPLPYLVRAGGGLAQLQARGPALGVDAAADYDETTSLLADGDRVVWYTDGLVEATDAGGRTFGSRRLRRLLGRCRRTDAVAIRDGLVDALVAFRGGAPASDDVAIVVAERRCG
ncbi:MAG: hypothetical protein D6689_06125 [Deltaproteobacteria bacterium]|nr:MAG: hypothetical protein D6689_06125 [Deltaproteobacteria bacterium]